MTTLFAETLKKLRTERGLSQIQLGKQMFVNNSTVARWESGKAVGIGTVAIVFPAAYSLEFASPLPEDLVHGIGFYRNQ
jgi:transcriptional regulator with XRE-family HTH domain